MKHLVIAEKPSVARDIARVLRCTKKTNSYIEEMNISLPGRWDISSPWQIPNNMASSIKPGTWTHSP